MFLTKNVRNIVKKKTCKTSFTHDPNYLPLSVCIKYVSKKSLFMENAHLIKDWKRIHKNINISYL